MTAATMTTGRPNQAPPKPPPKPSKIMLARSLRQLRPLSPGDDEGHPPTTTSGGVKKSKADHHRHNNRSSNEEGGEPQPSTSSLSTPQKNEHESIDCSITPTSSEKEIKKLPEKRDSWLRSRSSIRKPSIRPPPPPISPKPISTPKGMMGRATWQQQEQSPLRQSTSATDLYQAMPSPEDPEESIWGSEVRPTLPSMPPPSPPKPKAGDDEQFEELYEDIDIGFNVSVFRP